MEYQGTHCLVVEGLRFDFLLQQGQQIGQVATHRGGAKLRGDGMDIHPLQGGGTERWLPLVFLLICLHPVHHAVHLCIKICHTLLPQPTEL